MNSMRTYSWRVSLLSADYFSSTNNKDFTVNMDSIKEAANKAGENIRQGVDNIKVGASLQLALTGGQQHYCMVALQASASVAPVGGF